MKAYGFNAIRTSHNPPSRQFLDACDRIGILVIDEAFDMWEVPKNPDDYSRFFSSWWKQDIASMVLRDRNHPSVIMWSIGNEINERADSSGIVIGKNLINEIRQLDPGRPVTAAICEFWDHRGRPWEATAPAFEILDIDGYNYQWSKYEGDHKIFPDRIMVGTESIAMEAFENWNMVEKHPYIIGDFIWTAMDYIGEAAIGHSILDDQENNFSLPWPWYNANCGDIDLIGFKKPQLYYRDVVWNNSKIEILVHTPVPEGRKEIVSYWGWPDEWPSWNWKGHEGKPMDVRIFTRCSKVRLELNGKIIGEQAVSENTKLTALFEVPYEPGILKAIGLENDKEVCTKILSTAGDPVRIRLIPDRPEINADRNDLAYVKVEVTDEMGNIVPDAQFLVHLNLRGEGELAGAGNACPNEMASFQNPEFKTWHGVAMAIIRSNGKAGAIYISASAEGLKESELNIVAK
jgi:beta-galactosidase